MLFLGMHKAILHIGSNVGDRLSYLSKCRRLIASKIGKIETSSSVYETEAWGLKDQDAFLNQAFKVATTLDITDLLSMCQEIESRLNRERKIKWGPRTMDIDIIFYDDIEMDEEDLTIPHPRMHERNFVLFPLNEIVPDWQHPKLGKSVQQLINESQDPLNVSI